MDVQAARRFLREIDSWVLDRQRELTAIPAPPLGEGPRGERMAELFREVGLERVEGDEEGNVLARLPGLAPMTQPLILSAHLDTVFPAGTDVTPKGRDGVLRAPGIADDGRGLAALLGVARAMVQLGIHPPTPVLFVATVGEEGIGNLRGVRHLFREGGPGRDAQGFISLDGVGLERIITRGVGSTRLRVSIGGPGGHSWTDWGLPNPMHILGRIVAGMEDLPLPAKPRTTATAARWGGGKSINAIPQEAWVEVDLRSERGDELASAERAFLARCEQEVGLVLLRTGLERSTVTLEVLELGRRPPGATDQDARLVVAAKKATEELGISPVFVSSSTDANLPMALGIPAITLGAGGRAGGIHTLDEWYTNEKGPEGILRALLTIVNLD